MIQGRGEKCAVRVSLEEMETKIELPFSQTERPKLAVHDVEAGPLDIPLGELMKEPGAAEVLKKYLGEMLDSPMLSAMQGMSLKKLFSISGQGVPAGLEDALRGTVKT